MPVRYVRARRWRQGDPEDRFDSGERRLNVVAPLVSKPPPEFAVLPRVVDGPTVARLGRLRKDVLRPPEEARQVLHVREPRADMIDDEVIAPQNEPADGARLRPGLRQLEAEDLTGDLLLAAVRAAVDEDRQEAVGVHDTQNAGEQRLLEASHLDLAAFDEIG